MKTILPEGGANRTFDFTERIMNGHTMRNTRLFSTFYLVLIAGLVFGFSPETLRSQVTSINDKPEIDKQEGENLGETFSKSPAEPPIIIRNRQFAIPFTVPADGQVVPNEIELLYSNNEGKTWYSFARVPTSSPRKEFFFRAEQDGDYLFLLRTWFKNNESRVSSPQKIRVITTSGGNNSPLPAKASTPEPVSKEEVANNTPGLSAATPFPSAGGLPPLGGSTSETKTEEIKTPAPAENSSVSKSEETAVPEPQPLATQEVKSQEDKENKTDVASNSPATDSAMPMLTYELPEGAEGTNTGKNNIPDAPDVSQTANTSPSKAMDHTVKLPVVTPSPTAPLAPTPTGSAASADQENRVKKLLELAKTSSSSKPSTAITQVTTSNSGMSGSGTAATGTEATADVIRPGQIKSIAVGRTPTGEPTVMVRWVRPGEISQPNSKGGSLRIERSNSPNGPWTTVAEGLESDRNGYWWRATQFDAMPFYLRTVCFDSYGKEWTDVTTQEINLKTALAGQILPSSTEMTNLMAAGSDNNTNNKESEGVRTWQTPPVPEGAEDSGNQYLSGDNAFKNASMERSAGGTNPANSLTNGATQVEKTASVNKTETAFNYEPLPNPAASNPAAANSGGRWQTDPGRLTLNPLFTEGFGSLFQSRRPRSGGNAGNGSVPPAGAGSEQQGWYVPSSVAGGTTAVPPQSYESGYNGGYNGGAAPTMSGAENSSGYVDGGMGPDGSMPMGGMPMGDGTMGGGMPGSGDFPANAGEVIYLDEHGNRIANPFAAGGPFAGAPQQYGGMGDPGMAYPEQGFSYYNGSEMDSFNNQNMLPGANGPDESNWKPGTSSGT